MVNLQEHRPMEFEDVDATDEELVERYRRLFEMKQVELKCGLINERAIDFVNFLRPRSFEERKILREERELEQKIRAELEYREGLIWTKKRRGLSTEKEKVMEHRAIMTERIAEQMRKGKRLTKAQKKYLFLGKRIYNLREAAAVVGCTWQKFLAMHKFGLLPDGLHLGYECFDADVCDKVKDEINISALPRHQKNTHEDDIEIVTDWYTLMDHSEKYGLLRKYLQSGDNNAETVKGYSKALQDIVITHMQHFAEWINANT